MTETKYKNWEELEKSLVTLEKLEPLFEIGGELIFPKKFEREVRVLAGYFISHFPSNDLYHPEISLKFV